MLTRNGPEYRPFAAYLASRPDLFSLPECRIFQGVAIDSDPVSEEEIRRLFLQDFGASLEQVFLEFSSQPSITKPQFVVHAARLRSGEAVRVKINQPLWRSWQERCETSLPTLIHEPFRDRRLEKAPLELLLKEFHQHAWQSFDRRAEAAALTLAHLDLEGYTTMGVAPVVEELCSANVVTVRDVSCWRLHKSPIPAAETVHNLWLAWLQQVVLGRTVLIEATDDEIGIGEDHLLLLRGGLFLSFSEEVQECFANYLAALVAGDSQAAYRYLTEQMEVPSAGDHESLLYEFSRLNLEAEFCVGTKNSMEGIYKQWQLLRLSGGIPSPQLLAFEQGFFHIAELCNQISPSDDGFAAAAEHIHLRASLMRVRNTLEPERALDLVEQYGLILAEAPERLDTYLDKNLHLQVPFSTFAAGHRPTQFSSSIIMLLASVMLWCNFLAPRHRWAESCSTAALVFMAIALLWSPHAAE